MTTKTALVINGLTYYGHELVTALNESGYQAATIDNYTQIEQASAAMKGIDLLIHLPLPIKNCSLLKTSEEEIRHTYETAYLDAMLSLKAAASDMVKRQKGGVILILTDMDGFRARKDDFLSGSLHAALHRSIKSLALQLAPCHIRINCVAPGLIDLNSRNTNETKANSRLPMGRYGTTKEVVQTLLFLASDQASYITGTILQCDGGNSLAGMPETETGYGWDKDQFQKRFDERRATL